MKLSEQDVSAFAAYLRGEEKSPATVEKYRREAAGFVRWLAGRELSRELGRAYKDLLSQGRSPAGVNGALAALNRLFAFLGLPEYRLRAVKTQRRIFRDEARELNEEECRRLLSAAGARKNERLRLAMEAICSAGIRVGELRYFTVEDNGSGMDEKLMEQISRGEECSVGLRNTRERVEHLYGLQALLYAEASPMGGAKVCIVLPEGG